MMRVGVISDTHNYVNPKLFDVFRDVEHILHAGDICSMDVIIELSAIASVTAVRGNMESPELAARYPEELRTTLAGADIFMIHNGALLLRRPDLFNARCGPKRPDVFIYGHTHRADNKVLDGMLTLNPGSAGHPMLDMPASAAILVLEPKRKPRAEIVILES